MWNLVAAIVSSIGNKCIHRAVQFFQIENEKMHFLGSESISKIGLRTGLFLSLEESTMFDLSHEPLAMKP